MTLKILNFSLIVFLVITTNIMANSLDDANKYYNNGNFLKAYELYQVMAEEGNAKAQLRIGIMQLGGEGVSKNLVEGIKWYEMAAKKNHTEAQLKLGLIYYSNNNSEDFKTSFKWFKKALENGEDTDRIKKVAIKVQPIKRSQVYS